MKNYDSPTDQTKMKNIYLKAHTQKNINNEIRNVLYPPYVDMCQQVLDAGEFLFSIMALLARMNTDLTDVSLKSQEVTSLKAVFILAY